MNREKPMYWLLFLISELQKQKESLCLFSPLSQLKPVLMIEYI